MILKKDRERERYEESLNGGREGGGNGQSYGDMGGGGGKEDVPLRVLLYEERDTRGFI